jgi:hypothetical protein
MKTALRNWLNRWQGQGERRQPDQASILANCDEQSSQPSAAPQPAPQQPRQEQKQEPPQQAEPKQQQAQEPAAQQPAPKVSGVLEEPLHNGRPSLHTDLQCSAALGLGKGWFFHIYNEAL